MAGDRITSFGWGCRQNGARGCYDRPVFNFGRPKTSGQWIVHVAGAIVALFLVWWVLRLFVL